MSYIMTGTELMKSGKRFSNAMWEYSWLLQRDGKQNEFADWDKVLDEVVERGYQCLRIDVFPHQIAAGKDGKIVDEFEHIPDFNFSWTRFEPVTYNPRKGLVEFMNKCKDRGIYVGLSTWLRHDTTHRELEVETAEDFARIWIETLDFLAENDLLDGIAWVGTYLLNKQKTTTLEKILYGLGGVGMNLCWTFMMMFITVYYTNSAGIAAGVVGTFMLVSRLLDGVSDIVFAALMQKVHFKMGKVRPWFLIIAPVLGISLVLCFNVPAGWSASAKGIYAFITYAFTAAVSYTIVNLAFASFLPLISGDEDDRTKTSSVGNFIIMVGMMVMNYATPLLLALRGGENSQKAWTMISIIYAVLCTIFVAMISLIKEKEIVTAEAEEEIKAAEKQLTFTQALKYVLGNRYSWLLLAIFLFYYMLSGSTGGVIYY